MSWSPASHSTARGTRKAGGVRKCVTELESTLLRDLEPLAEPTVPGDPDTPLWWTRLSARALAVALDGLGHHVSHRWSPSCCTGPDIACRATSRRAHAVNSGAGCAVSLHRAARASGDSSRRSRWIPRKRIGRGLQERRTKSPPRMRVHDFLIKTPASGKAIPHGVLDLHRMESQHGRALNPKHRASRRTLASPRRPCTRASPLNSGALRSCCG